MAMGTVLYVPLSHRVHPDVPVERELYAPIAQAVHSDDPFRVLYVPTAHGAQADEPACAV